jgi:dethiobiotin synthetase
VTTAGLGTLNTTALTAEALRSRGVPLLGLVIGAWPAEPDLAARCNLADLPVVAGAPLLGALPAGMTGDGPSYDGADRVSLRSTARSCLAPALGGVWEGQLPTSRSLSR